MARPQCDSPLLSNGGRTGPGSARFSQVQPVLEPVMLLFKGPIPMCSLFHFFSHVAALQTHTHDEVLKFS
jgi:hypothetical protein